MLEKNYIKKKKTLFLRLCKRKNISANSVYYDQNDLLSNKVIKTKQKRNKK